MKRVRLACSDHEMKNEDVGVLREGGEPRIRARLIAAEHRRASRGPNPERETWNVRVRHTESRDNEFRL